MESPAGWVTPSEAPEGEPAPPADPIPAQQPADPIPSEEEEPVPAECPVCGSPNSELARFCQNCGTPLVEDAVPQAEPAPRAVATAVACEVSRDIAPWGGQDSGEETSERSAAALERARSVLQRYGGNLGAESPSPNTVVAVFGPEEPDGEAPLRAVRAAAEIRDAAPADEGEAGARAGVGSCDIVGDHPASESRAVERAVDLAVRLQRMAGRGEVIVGEDVYRRVGETATVEPVDRNARLDAGEPVGPLRLLSIVPELSAVPHVVNPPLVGREGELAALEEAFRRTVSRTVGEFVAVVGAIGLGKSRLVDEFLGRLEREDAARVLRVRCRRASEGGAAWPLAGIVEQAAGIGEHDSPEQARKHIDRLLVGEEHSEQVAERLAHAVGLPGGRAAIQETPWALRRLFEMIARRKPLVLAVDDADRAGPGFVHLLREIAASAHDAPLLVVCTFPEDPTRPEAAGSDAPKIVRIERLSDQDLASLVHHALGGADVGPEIQDLIGQVSEGSPFVAGQALALLIEEGLLIVEHGHWIPGEGFAGREMPSGIGELLEARLGELSLEERAVLGLAAVVGEVFHWSPVEGLLPEASRATVRQNLESLVEKHLIRPDPSEPEGAAYEFRHPLIREAAAASVPDESRADVHERYAGWLEGALGEWTPRRADILGSHLESAHSIRASLGPIDESGHALAQRAAALLEIAASRAAELGDASGAFRLFERASALLPSSDPRRAELLIQAALALADLGDLVRADSMLANAAREARVAGDEGVERRATVLAASLGARAVPGIDALERPRTTADRAIQAFGEVEDERGLAWAWSLRSLVHRRWGHAAAFEKAAEQAAEHARRAGRRREEVAALRDVAWATLHGPDPLADSAVRCEAAVDRLRGERPAEQYAAGALALLMARQGRHEEARELIAGVSAELEDLGLEEETATCLHRSGVIEWLAADVEAAEREMRSALETAGRPGSARIRSRVSASLAHVAVEAGRADEALELAQDAERSAAPEDVATQVQWRTARAKALARNGRLGEADALARRAVRMAEQTDSSELRVHALMDLAEVLNLAGRPNEATPFARRALRTCERKGAVAAAARANELLVRLGAKPAPPAPATPPPETAAEQAVRPEGAGTSEEQASDGWAVAPEHAPAEDVPALPPDPHEAQSAPAPPPDPHERGRRRMFGRGSRDRDAK